MKFALGVAVMRCDVLRQEPQQVGHLFIHFLRVDQIDVIPDPAGRQYAAGVVVLALFLLVIGRIEVEVYRLVEAQRPELGKRNRAEPIPFHDIAALDGRVLLIQGIELTRGAAVASVRGASLVEGRIYLKNGSVIECVGDDRLQLPKRFGKLTILRDAFRKTKAKEIFQSGEIDSVVCWHAQSPEHIRKFIPAESPGWMWVYLETPHICVCIYSEKGYGIDSNGGIQVWQRQGTFSQSRTAYYLKKTGEKEFLTVGAANRNTKDVFQERIARYVGDDPELAERIRLSSAIRSKTIQLLRDYDPTKY